MPRPRTGKVYSPWSILRRGPSADLSSFFLFKKSENVVKHCKIWKQNSFVIQEFPVRKKEPGPAVLPLPFAGLFVSHCLQGRMVPDICLLLCFDERNCERMSEKIQFHRFEALNMESDMFSSSQRSERLTWNGTSLFAVVISECDEKIHRNLCATLVLHFVVILCKCILCFLCVRISYPKSPVHNTPPSCEQRLTHNNCFHQSFCPKHVGVLTFRQTQVSSLLAPWECVPIYGR